MGEYIGKDRAARLWAKIKSEFLKNGSGITVSTDSKGVSDIKVMGNDINMTCRPADGSDTNADGNINIYGNVEPSDCPTIEESTVNVASADTLSVGVIDKLAKVVKSWMKFSQYQITMSAETIERNANRIEERCEWFQVFQKSEGDLNEKVFKVAPEGIVGVTHYFGVGSTSSYAAIGYKSVSNGSEIKLRGSKTNNITVGPTQNKIVGNTLFKDGELTMGNQYGSLIITPRLQKAFDISGMVPAVGGRYGLSATELDAFKMTPTMIRDLVEQGSVRLSDGNVSAYATITVNGDMDITMLIFSMKFDRKSTVEMRLTYLDGGETPVEGVVLHLKNYDIASNTEDGLMSAEDKKRLGAIYNSVVSFVPVEYADLNNVKSSLTYNFIIKTYNNVSGLYEEETAGLVIPSASADNAGLMSAQDKVKMGRFVFGPVLTTATGDINILNSQPNEGFRQIVAAAAKVKEARVIYGDTAGAADATYTCVVGDKGAITLTLQGGGIGAIYKDINNLSGTISSDMITLNGSLSAVDGDVTFEYVEY